MNQDRFRDQLSHPAPQHPRRGFTLVELLMVIVIIGILSALLVVASMSIIGGSREAATKATLSKINTMLKQRMAAFEVQLANDYSSKKHTFGADFVGLSEPAQKVLYRKRLFKLYFPQTWEEAVDLAQLVGITPPMTASDPESENGKRESAEVLYFILTKTGITSQGEIGQDAFLASEVSNSNGNDYPELVDAWGTPLRFYRWPCRLIKPTASADTDIPNDPELAAARTQIPALTKTANDPAINSDPDDPLNLQNTISGFATQYHFPKTYHTPLVVSAGVDMLFGLNSPIDSNIDNRQAKQIAGKTEELYDNLTNLNALAGGNQ